MHVPSVLCTDGYTVISNGSAVRFRFGGLFFANGLPGQRAMPEGIWPFDPARSASRARSISLRTDALVLALTATDTFAIVRPVWFHTCRHRFTKPLLCRPTRSGSKPETAEICGPREPGAALNPVKHKSGHKMVCGGAAWCVGDQKIAPAARSGKVSYLSAPREEKALRLQSGAAELVLSV